MRLIDLIIVFLIIGFVVIVAISDYKKIIHTIEEEKKEQFFKKGDVSRTFKILEVY